MLIEFKTVSGTLIMYAHMCDDTSDHKSWISYQQDGIVSNVCFRYCTPKGYTLILILGRLVEMVTLLEPRGNLVTVHSNKI